MSVTNRSVQIPILKEKDSWVLWSRRMKAILREENLLNTLNPPTKDDDSKLVALTATQKRENNKAISLILSCIDNDQMNHFDEDEDSAHAIWEALRVANFADNSTSRATLRMQLTNMAWEEKDTIDSYVSRAKGYQSKLKQLDSAMGKEEFVAAILKGLSGKYNTTKQSITTQVAVNPKISIDIIIHLLTLEEVRQK